MKLIIMPNQELILSCDIGGTHITSAIVDKTTWTILEDTITRNHVNSQADAKSILQCWTGNMKSCLSKIPDAVTAIGIAAPGPFDYEKGIALMKGQAKYDSLYQMEVSEPIKELIGQPDYPIRYINDAAAFLQGEVFGCGLDQEECILGITLGTGLGSAVWQKGEKAYDADLWDTPYQESIFEEYLVTRFFVKRFAALTGIEEAGLREILEKHVERPETALLLEEYRDQLLDFLYFFSQKYTCNRFVIGGNITKAWDLIFPDKSMLKPYQIEIGKFQEHAAIIGAASLFSN